ncbi:hypothetical protein F2P81_017212 [Scophthalmus maximus]|uniref:Uncharacterized protein n=1 Tax=Scophthalmus maximus TaxID=52904 RepID=A0A6A4SH44_SCOMX|nr:hypothetical protein F2P81_017212 [Scophthalmus maximus]
MLRNSPAKKLKTSSYVDVVLHPRFMASILSRVDVCSRGDEGCSFVQSAAVFVPSYDALARSGHDGSFSSVPSAARPRPLHASVGGRGRNECTVEGTAHFSSRGSHADRLEHSVALTTTMMPGADAAAQRSGGAQRTAVPRAVALLQLLRSCPASSSSSSSSCDPTIASENMSPGACPQPAAFGPALEASTPGSEDVWITIS